MKKILIVLSLVLVMAWAGQAAAVVYDPGTTDYNFTPEPNDLYGLEHGKYYTWGENWAVPDGETIVGATLKFYGIRNWTTEPNDLYVHLLDSAAEGVGVYSDNVSGDYFDSASYTGTEILLNHWHNLPSTAQDITYNFTSDEIATLVAYLADENFGLGFDPDCHFYNSGIELIITTGKSAVPIPGAVWLLGSGLMGLVGLKRKMRS